MRAGLNELSDDKGYDFIFQMPTGRVVFLRITKVHDGGARFDCSMRKSLVVYGVYQVAVLSWLQPLLVSVSAKSKAPITSLR